MRGRLVVRRPRRRVQRIRPNTVTVVTTFIGLLPLMLTAQDAGVDTMRRLAAPRVGGLCTAFILGSLLYPLAFCLAMRMMMHRQLREQPTASITNARGV